VRVLCSWSGGKESCLACYQAMQEGHEVTSLLTVVTTTGNYTRSHRLSAELLMAQSQAVGIPLYQRRASWNTYEREFTRALTSLKRKDIEGGIFGDLALDEHREWVERVCTKAGIVPLLPLWGMERKNLLRAFMTAGFEAIVVAVRNDIMDDHWLGRQIDEDFVAQMEKRGIDVCGENGEYHTLVIDGPIFKRRIALGETKMSRRGTMTFLQVLGYSLADKR
jgi:diphthine-ammonia ligase